MSQGNSPSVPSQPNERARADLLLADLNHFSQSMWRNEEVGEKRFNFFLTLVTAVMAGLVALETHGGVIHSRRMIYGLAILFLFMVGIMTYLRMLKRNHVTDEYQRTLKSIRKNLSDLAADHLAYHVPVRSTPLPWLFSGGYAESLAVMNGLLLAGFVYIVWCSSVGVAAILGAEAIALLLIPPFLRHRRKTAHMHDPGE